MRSVRLTCVAAGIVGLTVMGFAADAPAAYLQLTQERALSARATASVPGAPVDDPKSETSTALGSFDRSFTASAAVPRPNWPGEFARADASAGQAVVLGGSSIEGQLRINGTTGTLAPGETASTAVFSRWTTTFTVDTPTPFQLSGHMSLQRDGLGSPGTQAIVFSFSGSGGESFFNQGGIGAELPIAASGVLQPGRVYTLNALLDGQNSAGGSSDGFSKDVTGSINFSLALPEPGSAVGLVGLGLLALVRRRRRVGCCAL